MNVVWLHKPVHTFDEVAALVDAQVFEDQHLDFKRELGTDDELAKDVVAFLNADGGTLIIGVNDKADRASGFFPEFKIGKLAKEVIDKLMKRISPAGAVNTLLIEPLVGTHGGAAREVLAIHVPPWPHGPVAAGGAKAADGYRFPFRLGRDTRFHPLEDALVAFDSHRRSNYLRLRALAESGEKRVYIASRIVVRFQGEVAALNTPMRDGHGWLREGPSVDTVTVVLDRSHVSEWKARQMQSVRMSGIHGPDHEFFVKKPLLEAFGKYGASVKEPPEHPLTIPLDLIRSVWSDRHGDQDYVHLFLDADLRWDGTAWSFCLA